MCKTKTNQNQVETKSYIRSESRQDRIWVKSFSLNSCVLFMYCANDLTVFRKKVSLLIKLDNRTDNKDFFFLPVIPVMSKTETSPSNNGNNSWHDICYITYLSPYRKRIETWNTVHYLTRSYFYINFKDLYQVKMTYSPSWESSFWTRA